MNNVTAFELRKHALEMWANHIETEDATLSIKDVRDRMSGNTGDALKGLQKIHARWENLSTTSYDLVCSLRGLAYNESLGAKRSPLTSVEKDLISQSLRYWANWIETGAIQLSKDDLTRQISATGLTSFNRNNPKVNFKHLGQEQLDLVKRLRALSVAAINVEMTPYEQAKAKSAQSTSNPARKSLAVTAPGSVLWDKTLQLRAASQNGNDVLVSTQIGDELAMRLANSQITLREYSLKSLSFELKSPVSWNDIHPVNVFNTTVEVDSTHFRFKGDSYDSRYAGGIVSNAVDIENFFKATRGEKTSGESELSVDGDNVFADRKSQYLFKVFQEDRQSMTAADSPRG